MSERPSDVWEIDELREEFDWMSDFLSHMAERIRNDPDVHNLSDYVRKLESQNERLLELLYEIVESEYIGPHDKFSDFVGEDLEAIGIDADEYERRRSGS